MRAHLFSKTWRAISPSIRLRTGYKLRVVRCRNLTLCSLPTARRPGTTFVELLLFVAILAIVSVAVLPLLFASTEDRLLQQTVSIVEQNGTQILQVLGLRVRDAERILLPAASSSGTALVLQTGTASSNPTILGVLSGSLLLIRHTDRETVSSSQVGIDRFVVRNTSISSARQSVEISFRLTRTIRLQAPRTYSRTFTAAFTLLPDDEWQGDDCGCTAPSCPTADTISWQVCESSQCLTATTGLECR